MGNAMDEVIRDMLADNINRKTIERQQQILSRMLDAQKSVREREFSKKRRAEQARKYFAIDPGEISGSEDILQKNTLMIRVRNNAACLRMGIGMVKQPFGTRVGRLSGS